MLEILSLFHPALASFSVSATVLAVLFACVWLYCGTEWILSAARLTLAIATVCGVCAFFSGYGANEFAEITFSIPDEPLAFHHLWSKFYLLALFCAVAFGEWYALSGSVKTRLKVAFLLFLLISVVLGVILGKTGSSLVFTHGAGVSTPVEQVKKR